MKEIKMAFKFALGAYLGWQVAHGFDAAIGKRIAPKVKKLINDLDAELADVS